MILKLNGGSEGEIEIHEGDELEGLTSFEKASVLLDALGATASMVLCQYCEADERETVMEAFFESIRKVQPGVKGGPYVIASENLLYVSGFKGGEVNLTNNSDDAMLFDYKVLAEDIAKRLTETLGTAFEAVDVSPQAYEELQLMKKRLEAIMEDADDH